MTYATRNEALASLREFTPWMRKGHMIIRVWSEKHNAHRYGRVLTAR